MIAMAIAGVTSVAGRCHTFGSRADGFVRGEGCSVAVIAAGAAREAELSGKRDYEGTRVDEARTL